MVLEELWPDVSPNQASNSLHQTLYFLRKELVESHSRPLVEYIPVESEIVYLDPDLVHIDSVAFMRQASDLMASGRATRVPLHLLESYRGPFAPEFEYDEWAIPWRDSIHSAFLHLSEGAARARLRDGLSLEATRILAHAVDVDPRALEMRGLMVAALEKSGSAAAARQLYVSFADQYRKDYAAEPPTLAALLQDANAL
jgi:DNA-binding SARP family transcriptional activator